MESPMQPIKLKIVSAGLVAALLTGGIVFVT